MTPQFEMRLPCWTLTDGSSDGVLNVATFNGSKLFLLFTDEDLAERHVAGTGQTWLPCEIGDPISMLDILENLALNGVDYVVVDQPGPGEAARTGFVCRMRQLVDWVQNLAL